MEDGAWTNLILHGPDLETTHKNTASFTNKQKPKACEIKYNMGNPKFSLRLHTKSLESLPRINIKCMDQSREIIINVSVNEDNIHRKSVQPV